MTSNIAGPKTPISYVDDVLNLWRESGIRVHDDTYDEHARDAALDQMVAAVARAMAAARAEALEEAALLAESVSMDSILSGKLKSITDAIRALVRP